MVCVPVCVLLFNSASIAGPSLTIVRKYAKIRNYRLLFFFHGQIAVVLFHGLRKEKAVPHREIELAIERKAEFTADPDKYSVEEV
jgi:phage-related protein